ncbi:MAG: hypothetical protein A2X56_07955 [Nitrospirae bacterium GWC2_57_13]|jgi:zinc protease|nr:MAG: hypothetical protein A2072_01240 [Nitrospirae bacterium GWC1_57_7]OGW29966.1 MAG: hypothetical protein A2X56_07955 [Nitrospirae bacterium GWC2_57_13]OGW45137.1 MAG: hypothetical protein A2X57_02665 [Nitrospirae bacterium GWD2_57_8]
MVNVRRTIRTGACAVVVAALLATAGAAHAAKPIGKRIVLDNGMVLLLAEKRDLPVVTVSMAIKAGSMVEPADKPGLASLTASLLMQGTARRNATQISNEIDFVGGSLSVSGGSDFASAGLRVLKKDLRLGLDLLSDVLRNPVFDQKEIDRKVRETLAGIQSQKDEPGVVADDAFTRAVFGSHPYGRTNDDVAAYLPRLKKRDLAEFHGAFYGPDTAIIAVVGDVSEQEIVHLLQEYFKGWKRAPRPAPSIAPMPARERRDVIAIEKDITQANIVLGHIGISREDPDYYAVLVMNYILGGGGFSSRLMDNIRDNRGLAYSVYSSFSAQKEPGAFSAEVQTKNESANEAIAEILKELGRIRTEPVTDRELADAKAYITGSFPLRMDTSAKIAGILTAVEIYNLGLDYPQKYPALINAVTKEDILRVAKRHLHPDRVVIVVVADQAKAKVH